MKEEQNNKINKLLEEYIHDFNKKKNLPFVVKDSIPIVWFGDINMYLSSPKKILTVGLNPSEQEFMKKDSFGEMVTLSKYEQRFEQIDLSQGTNETNVAELKNTLNNYFEVNPYKWFNKYNKLIEVFDCSYGGKYGSLTNTAIHIDIYSAIATTPTWGKLDERQRKQIINFNLFNELLESLNPDLILVSVNKETFDNVFDGYKTLSDNKFTGNNSIKVVEYDGRIVINGTNMQGTPFGGIKEESVKEVFEKTKNLCFYKRCRRPQIECSIGYLIDAGCSIENIRRGCELYSRGYCISSIEEDNFESWGEVSK